MAKRVRRHISSLAPAGSRVRPGLRRFFRSLIHSGKLAALLLGALAGWGIYHALTSPRYHVRTVEARGVRALTQEDVATLAAVDGARIWDVETGDMEQRISQSPYVQHVDARLVLPDRLVVEVTERKPDVRWLHNGTAYAVTWEGLVVDEAPEVVVPAALTNTDVLSGSTVLSETTGLSTTLEPKSAVVDGQMHDFESSVTILDTTPNRPLKVGDRVDADALELARRVILRAPTELPVPLTRIEWDGGLGVSLIVGDGRQVVLGRSDELDRKLATLRYLLLDNTAFKYLDLRPTTPYYRP